MEKILAILSEDYLFSKRLSSIVRKSKGWRVSAFDSVEGLYSFSAEHAISFLLTEEKWKGKFDKEDFEVVYLSEYQKNEKGCVYKYQPADGIIKESFASYGESVEQFYENKDVKIITVFSPIGRCGKTEVAQKIAKKLSEQETVLLISFEEISVRYKKYESEKAEGLTEAFYFFKQKNLTEEKIAQILSQNGNLFFLKPVNHPEDLLEMTSDELREFLQMLSEKCRCKYVVVDTDSNMGRFCGILRESHKILVPMSVDPYSEEAVLKFQRHLRERKINEKNQIVRLKMPEKGLSEEAVRELVALCMNGEKKYKDG